MAQIEKIHAKKTPKRPHFIAEWMEKRGVIAADVVRDIGVDKGTISRWLDGTCPNEEWQIKLGAYFSCGRDGIFRHPDEDWMKRFLENRPAEEVERIKQAMEISFPKAKAANGGRKAG